MKKIALIVMLFAVFRLSAQEFHFIPKIGLNFANMTNMEGSMKPGLNIGVAGEMMLTSHFAIEPGVYYSMQGTKVDEVSLKIKNDYLNIPVLFKGYVYEGFNLFAGPQLGFKVSSKAKLSGSGASITTDAMSDAFKSVDFGIVVGAGYQSSVGLLFSLSYNIGLANVLDGDKLASMSGMSQVRDEKCRNGVLQFNLGWRF